MLTIDQLRQIRALLTSDRLTVGGHELLVVAGLVSAIQAEELRLVNAARIRETPKAAEP